MKHGLYVTNRNSWTIPSVIKFDLIHTEDHHLFPRCVIYARCRRLSWDKREKGESTGRKKGTTINNRGDAGDFVFDVSQRTTRVPGKLNSSRVDTSQGDRTAVLWRLIRMFSHRQPRRYFLLISFAGRVNHIGTSSNRNDSIVSPDLCVYFYILSKANATGNCFYWNHSYRERACLGFLEICSAVCGSYLLPLERCPINVHGEK